MSRYLPFALLLLLATWLSSCSRPPPVPQITEITAKADGEAAAADEPDPQFGEEDWPMWRGPNVDGVSEGPPVPAKWTKTQNVIWSTRLPGRGHSSPIVVGERIYLETADETKKVQSVLCLDRQ